MEETETGTSESVNDAAGDTAGGAVAQFTGTKHKVKINDREIEVPYEELVADYQQKTVSQRKFAEAAQMRKQVDEFVDSLKSGNLGLLKKHVPPELLRQFAEQELREYIEYEQMPEPDKKRLAAEQERDEYRKRLEEAEAEKTQAYQAQLEAQATKELDQEISEAIKQIRAENGIDPRQPVEPWFVDHVARIMLAQLEAEDDESVERMPAKEAASKAWKGVENTVVNYLNTIPTDKVIALLPRELRDAIRKADLGEVVTKLHGNQKTSNQVTAPTKKREKPSTDDFFAQLDKRFGN